MQTRHYNITVSGRVQGVWFRKYTCDKADELGITGFVENKPDGTVYVEAEGREGDLKKFIEWLHRGSPRSEVQQVAVAEGEPKNYRTFTINRKTII